MTEQISIKQLKAFMKKIRISSGETNILLIKRSSPLAEREAVETISRALSNLNTNAVILIGDSLDDVDSVGQLELRKHGWYKLQDIRRLAAKTTRQ